MTISGFSRPQWQVTALDDAQRAEVEQAQTSLEEALVPVDPKKLLLMVREAAQVHGVKVDEGDFAVRQTAMVNDLAEFSERHIAAAFVEHRRTKTFFPSIKEIRDLCLTKACTARVYQHRAQVLLGFKKPRSFEIPEPTRDDSDTVNIAEKLKELPADQQRLFRGVTAGAAEQRVPLGVGREETPKTAEHLRTTLAERMSRAT